MRQLPISVIIPAHNAAKTIEGAIDSIRSQTMPPQEVIVVDDASTDDTRDILEGMGCYPASVRVIRSTARGAAAARNQGVANASSPVIAFLDADDRWRPTKLEKQWPILEADATSLVGCLMAYRTPSGRTLGHNARFREPEEATKALRAGKVMPLAVSGWLLRKELFERAGGFDESFRRAQDFELACRLAQQGTSLNWPDGVLLEYLVHENGVTATSYVEQYLAAELVRYRLQNPSDLRSYEDWMTAPQIGLGVKRRYLAGRSYRTAAVRVAQGRRMSATVHIGKSALLDPLGTFSKLAWRVRSERTQPG